MSALNHSGSWEEQLLLSYKLSQTGLLEITAGKNCPDSSVN